MENQTKKILIVEDDESLRKSLVDLFKNTNYEILQAGDGEEAVSQTLDQRPDLILLDLLLPKLDGFEVLNRIRYYPDEQIAATKVIVLSNLWSNKDILRIQALKIDEYYVKANTNLADVLNRVNLILNPKPV